MAVPTSNILATRSIFYTLQLILVPLRFWVCRRQGLRLKSTDYLIMIAFIFVCSEVVVLTSKELLEIKGEKEADPNNPLEMMIPLAALPEADMIRYKKLTIMCPISFTTVVWAAKGAFLAMYHNLGEALSKPMRVAVWIGIVYTSLTYVVMILSYLSWCRPISVVWTVNDIKDPRYCNYWEAPLFILHSTSNLSTDLFILIFSLLIVRSLHLQHRELAGFAFVVALGSASIVAGIARLVVMFPIHRDISSVWTWKQKVSITILVEQFTAVVACCLPAFRIYLRSAKSKAAVWPRESGLPTIGGGNPPRARYGAAGEMELASYKSTGKILAGKDLESLPEADSKPQSSGGH